MDPAIKTQLDVMLVVVAAALVICIGVSAFLSRKGKKRDGADAKVRL